MSKSKTYGIILLVGGIIILIGYGIFLGIQEIEAIDYVIAVGAGAIIIGFLVLLISIIMEQQEGKKKMKNEIKKEDLEP